MYVCSREEYAFSTVSGHSGQDYVSDRKSYFVSPYIGQCNGSETNIRFGYKTDYILDEVLLEKVVASPDHFDFL